MGQINVINERDIPWKPGRNYDEGGVKRWVNNRVPIAKAAGGMWLGRVKYDPNMRVEPHRHAANEIIYILSGELTFGDRVYPPGTSVTIEANTLYGPLIAGPQGAEFLLIMDRQP